MIEKNIQTQTITMSVLEEGKGPLVLLCHGFPETKFAWRHQIVALAKAGYRAVAPDMRGYGLSDAPEQIDQYSVNNGVEDLIALMDALGEKRAYVIGHDWGATIAWQAALLRPDRIVGIAALSVPMMGQPPVPPSQIFPQNQDAQFYTLYFQEPGIAEAEFEADIALTLCKLYYAGSGSAGARKAGDGTPNPFGMVDRRAGLLAALPDPVTLPDWLPQTEFDRIVQSFKISGFRGGLNYYRNLDRNWERQRDKPVQKVSVPALFLIGDRDTAFGIPGMKQIIDQMPDLVPDLRGSYIIEGAGHWLQQESPSEVSRKIIEFIQNVKT